MRPHAPALSPCPPLGRWVRGVAAGPAGYLYSLGCNYLRAWAPPLPGGGGGGGGGGGFAAAARDLGSGDAGVDLA